MKYFIIGDEDTVLGFSLTGVSGISCKNSDEARRAWDIALKDKDNGVIVVTYDVSEMIRDVVDRYLFKETFPLVVEIPSSDGRKGRDLRTLVNEAIGVSI